MSDSTPQHLKSRGASLPPSFVAALRCPLTAQRLEEVTLEALSSLGFGGAQVAGWTGALLTEDRLALFPVRGEIPVLLSEERLTVGTTGGRAA
jgi:uncharacterized protein YbaR (Trm112 family)